MNHFSINISNLNTISEISYSRPIDVEKDQAIRAQIISLAKKIISQIPQDNLERVEDVIFNIESKDKFSFIVKLKDGENITSSIDSLDIETKEKGKLLMEKINSLNLLTLQEKKVVRSAFDSLAGSSANEIPLLQKFIRFIHRSFSFYRIITPIINQIIVDEIKNKNSEQLKELYAQPQKLFENIKKNLISKVPSELFNESELEEIINEKLIENINDQLIKSKESQWNQETLYQLEIQRLFKSIETHGFLPTFANSLSKITPLDIPFTKLAKIPITKANQELLTNTWKQLLGNLFLKGRLDELSNTSSLKDTIVQSRYACNYLKAVQTLPKTLKQRLDPFLTDLDRVQSPQVIRSYLLQTSELTQLESLEEEDDFRRELDIYNKKIKPQFKKFIEAKKEQTRDIIEIVKFLSFEKSIREEFDKQIDKIYVSLGKKKAIFKKVHLKKLLMNEFERVAVFEHQLSTVQLNNLKNKRNRRKKVSQKSPRLDYHDKEILTIIKNYKMSKNAILLKNLSIEETRNQIQILKNGFLIQYGELLRKKSPSVKLLAQLKYSPSENEIYFPMLQNLLTNFFEESRMIEISPEKELTQDVKNQIAKYFKAKAKILKLQLPKEIQLSLNQMMESLESGISNIQIREYLKTPQISRLNRLLFTQEVFDDLREKTDNTASMFNKEELIDLMYLSKLINDSEENIEMTPENKLIFQSILNKNKDNQNLIEKLKILESGSKSESPMITRLPSILKGIINLFIKKNYFEKPSRIPLGISQKSIDFLKFYIATTQNIAKKIERLDQIQKKAENLIRKYKSNLQIESWEKLSLKEIGMLSRFGSLKDKLAEFETLLKDSDTDLQKLSQIIGNAHQLYKEIEEIVTKSANQHYQDGSLLAYQANKKTIWMDKPLPLEERLTAYAANGFTHGAKLYHKENSLFISHLYGNLEQNPISLYQLCISDIWELDIAPLVTPEMALILSNVYGLNWQTIIKQQYQEIERNLHSEGFKRFQYFANDPDRRLAAGFADHPMLYKLLGQKNVKGHQKKEERDINEFHRKFFGNTPLDSPQICSEFTSKVTLASMIHLNKMISMKIAKAYPKFTRDAILKKLHKKGIVIPPQVEEYLKGIRYTKKEASKTSDAEQQLIKLLQQLNYSSKDIQLIIRLGNEEIFDLPYDKKERLKAIHPGRMVKLLVDKKCARLKPPPPELLAFVDLRA